MKTGEKVALGCFGCLALVGVAVALVAPTVAREFRRFSAPIERVKSKQKALDEMTAKEAWKRPEKDALSPDDLDRFFAVRQRIDAVRRERQPQLEKLPRRGQVRGIEGLKQAPGVIEGVTGAMTAEMDVFLEGKMSPSEYHWIERLVYQRWRGALRRTRTYPTALAEAAAEVEAASQRESDPRVRQRLRAVAEELRRRMPAPPEGFDPQIHALLLSRIDAIERWSMDDLGPNNLPPVR
jgi:hypothetical protein